MSLPRVRTILITLLCILSIHGWASEPGFSLINNPFITSNNAQTVQRYIERFFVDGNLQMTQEQAAPFTLSCLDFADPRISEANRQKFLEAIQGYEAIDNACFQRWFKPTIVHVLRIWQATSEDGCVLKLWPRTLH